MLRTALAFLIALASAQTASACIVTHLLTPERAAEADFVVAGRVVSYQQNMWDSFPKDPEYAVIRLAVSEVWKGEVGEEFEFLLTPAGSWPLEDRTDWEGEVIIAATDPGRPGEPPLASLPRVEQRICAMPFALVTDETLAAYRDWFKSTP